MDNTQNKANTIEEQMKTYHVADITYKVAKGQPLSDIQEYNLWLKRLVVTLSILGFLALFYLLWLTYYVISNNVLNNIVARCI